MVLKAARERFKGFTLSELLIALAVLGVIATFTIPKVLQSQQDSKYNTIAKEAASAVSDAYNSLRLAGKASTSSQMQDLTPYLNYVKVDSTTIIDNIPGIVDASCADANRQCLVLHNGAYLRYGTGASHTFTGDGGLIWFYIDPDGKRSGTSNGTGKSVQFNLYQNGRITSIGMDGGSSDPDWFKWN